MILDTLDHAGLYAGLGERFAAAFEFLNRTDLAELPAGRIDLQGDALYALVQRYTTRPMEQGKWEAHRRYADIQYQLAGRERIGVAHISRLQAGEYQPERDVVPLSGAGHDLVLFPTAFAVFFPQDAHMPGLAVEQPEAVVKVVLKVLLAS